MHFIVFHLNLLYIKKLLKNVWLVFIHYILKNYDLQITYYIYIIYIYIYIYIFVIYKDGSFETSKI